MTKPLNVLIVGAYPEQDGVVVGGVQAATQTLARALSAQADVEQVLVAAIPRQGGGDNRRESDKLEVRFIRTGMRGDLIRRSAPFRRALQVATADFKPDVVHGQGLDRAGRVASRLGLPSVVTIHGHLEAEARLAARTVRDHLKSKMIEFATRDVLKKTDVLISISPYDQKYYGDYSKKFHNIPNAISPVFFNSAPYRNREPILLFAGMISDRKNILGLIDAFELVARQRPDAQLRLAGEAWDKAYLARVNARLAASACAKSVHILGHITTEQLAREMNAASALVLFSNEENAPIVISQAMALGVPVVASDVGGISAMLAQGGGAVVSAKDSAAFAGACIALLADPARAAQTGRAGAEIARRTYSPEGVADLTVLAYRDAIERHARR